MRFRVTSITNRGKTRSVNQDALLIQDTLIDHCSMDEPARLEFEAEKAWFAVADGLGGEAAGDEASAETLKVLREGLSGAAGLNDLVPLIGKARQRLDAIASDRKIRLGTTLAGLFIAPGGSFVFNIGDCRVYKLKAGFLNRLTRDHSLLEMASHSGTNATGVAQNIVTSAVMGGDATGPEVFTRAIGDPVRETFLLCCDGLWGAIPVEELEGAFKAPDRHETVLRLLAAALRSGDDNISAIIVETGVTSGS